MCLDAPERLGCAYREHSSGTSAAHWTCTSSPHHACQLSLMQTDFTLKGCHMALLHASSQQGLSDHLTTMRSNQLWTSSSEICFKWDRTALLEGNAKKKKYSQSTSIHWLADHITTHYQSNRRKCAEVTSAINPQKIQFGLIFSHFVFQITLVLHSSRYWHILDMRLRPRSTE